MWFIQGDSTFLSLGITLCCNESKWAIFSSGTVYHCVKGDAVFQDSEKHCSVLIRIKDIEGHFHAWIVPCSLLNINGVSNIHCKWQTWLSVVFVCVCVVSLLFIWFARSCLLCYARWWRYTRSANAKVVCILTFK